MCIEPDHIPRRLAPLPSLAQLQTLSVNNLLSLVQRASEERLRELWDTAGIEEPEVIKSCGCRDECDCACEILDIRFNLRDWYFPEDVLAAIQARLPEYAEPIVEPPSTLVCQRAARVGVMAQRRGEGQPNDSPEARANPLIGCSLWQRGDNREGEGHLQREVSRARNGSVVVGKVTVAGRTHGA